jgi:hypothetical protein
MKIFPLLCLGVLTSLVVVPVKAEGVKATVSKERPQASPAVQQTFELLMGCIENNNFSGFQIAIDDDFKVALTEEIFKSVVEQMAVRQKQGYQSLYLEEMKQQGYQVHIWKLTFKDAGDDVLVKLSIKDGKVGGLFLL